MDIGNLRKEQGVCDAKYFQDAGIDSEPNKAHNRLGLLHETMSGENTILHGTHSIHSENLGASKCFFRN